MRSRKQSLISLKEEVCKRLPRRRSILSDSPHGLSALLRNINMQISATSNLSVNELDEVNRTGREVRASSVPPFAHRDSLGASSSSQTDGDDGDEAISSSGSESDDEEDEMMVEYLNELHAHAHDSNSSLTGTSCGLYSYFGCFRI